MSNQRSDVLAGVVFTSSLAALVALHLTNHADGVGDLIALAGPVVAAIFVVNTLAGRVDETRDQVRAHTQTLDTIERQTNGVLDERIRTGVKAAMAEVAAAPNNAAHTPPAPSTDTPPF